MEEYMSNFQSYKEIIIYDFNLNSGGLGDFFQFFRYILSHCIPYKKRLYYKKNNIEIENYIKFKYDIMNITDETILDNYKIVTPFMFYGQNNDYPVNSEYFLYLDDIFYFSNEIIINSQKIFPSNITNYISIHLRLGDKYLEIPFEDIYCKDDSRDFSEEKINNIIEENMNECILFCCDNNAFRQKIKKKYNNVYISSGEIGHTTYITTTKKQVLDTVTEFYLLINSKKIYAASRSGFSYSASIFKNNQIPYISL
jgi:hypothetical protein